MTNRGIKKTAFLLLILLTLQVLSGLLIPGYPFTYDSQINPNYEESIPTSTIINSPLTLSEILPQWTHDTEIKAGIRPVAVSADGDTIIESSGYSVYVIDVSSEAVIWEYNTSSIISDVGISDDGTHFVVGTYDNMTILFGRASNQSIWSAKGNHWIMTVEISGDGSTVVSGDWGGRVYVYDETSNISLSEHDTVDRVIDISTSYNGSIIAVGGVNESIYLIERGVSTPKWSYTTNDVVHSVSVSENGSIVAAASFAGVFVFESGSNQTLWQFDQNSFQTIELSKDGSTIAAGKYLTNDVNLFVWNIQSNESLWTFNNTDQIRDVAVSADGSHIAAGGYDNRTYLFTRNNNDSIISYIADGDIVSVDLDSDGKTLVSSSSEGKTFCWKITAPNITSIESPNGYENTTTPLDFRVNITRGSFEIASCVLRYSHDSSDWQSVSLQNLSALTESQVSFTGSIGLLSEGIVEYIVEVNDSASYEVESQLESLTVDGSPPLVEGIILPTEIPSSSDNVEITVEVSDMLSGIESGILYYTNNSGVSWYELNPLNIVADDYVFSIPKMSNGTTVQFYVEFSDIVENTIVDDNDGEFYEYQVVDVTTSHPPDTPQDTTILVMIGVATIGILLFTLLYYIKFRGTQTTTSSSVEESAGTALDDAESASLTDLEENIDE